MGMERLPISTVLILLAFIFLRFVVMTKVPLLVGQILQQVVFFLYCIVQLFHDISRFSIYLDVHLLFKMEIYSIQFNSVYLPIKGPRGETGKLYIDE